MVARGGGGDPTVSVTFEEERFFFSVRAPLSLYHLPRLQAHKRPRNGFLGLFSGSLGTTTTSSSRGALLGA